MISALDHEGLYRLAGVKSRVEDAKTRFDRGTILLHTHVHNNVAHSLMAGWVCLCSSVMLLWGLYCPSAKRYMAMNGYLFWGVQLGGDYFSRVALNMNISYVGQVERLGNRPLG